MENEKWKMKNGKGQPHGFFLLTKHVFRLGWFTKLTFWETSWEMSTASAADTMTHLPALAAAVGKRYDSPKHSEYTRKRQGWQRRLVDEYESTRRVAELDLLRQALEQGDGEALRRVTWKV